MVSKLLYVPIIKYIIMQVDICVRAFKMHIDKREKERAAQQEQSMLWFQFFYYSNYIYGYVRVYGNFISSITL